MKYLFDIYELSAGLDSAYLQHIITSSAAFPHIRDIMAGIQSPSESPPPTCPRLCLVYSFGRAYCTHSCFRSLSCRVLSID